MFTGVGPTSRSFCTNMMSTLHAYPLGPDSTTDIGKDKKEHDRCSFHFMSCADSREPTTLIFPVSPYSSADRVVLDIWLPNP